MKLNLFKIKENGKITMAFTNYEEAIRYVRNEVLNPRGNPNDIFKLDIQIICPLPTDFKVYGTKGTC